MSYIPKKIDLSKHNVLLILLCNLALTSTARAEQSVQTAQINEDTPYATLDTVVVTATRSQKWLSNTPIAVQVLDSKTLQDNHAQTLKQALELLTNVTLTPLHGKTGYEVRMQGFSGDQVLVLIDGLPVSASTGSKVNLSQYLNTNVAQIEVIQGAASAQYGSAAMGGVINIITKPVEQSQANLSVELGSNGEQNPSDNWLDTNRSFIEGNVAGKLTQDGRLKARLSGSYLEDNGLSLDNDAWSRLKDGSRQRQINTKIIYTPYAHNSSESDTASPDALSHTASNTSLWLEAGYYDERDTGRFNYNVPPVNIRQQRNENIERKRIVLGGQTQFIGMPLPFTKRSEKQVSAMTETRDESSFDINSEATSDTLSETFFYPTDDYRLSGSLLYESYDSNSDTYAYGQSSKTLTSGRTTHLETYLGQVQLDLPYIEYGDHLHEIQLGAKWQKDELNQFKNGMSELIAEDVDKEVIETYLQDDWMFGEDMEVVTGVRYQNDSDFGSHFAPKIALKKNLFDSRDRKHTFRASVGQGYRVPNLKERYFVFDHSNLGYKVMGNPDLVPEESTSYQIGYETALTESVAFKVNGFYNNIKDLIQTDNDHPTYAGTTAIYDYKNINKAKTYGADTSLNWQPNPKTHLNLGYAYLHTEDTATGSELTYSPKHKLSANIDYQLNDRLQLIQHINYESRQLVNTAEQIYSPSWWQLDSRINYKLSPQFDTYFAINNITNEQREASNPNDQRPVDNRQWIIGANYHW